MDGGMGLLSIKRAEEEGAWRLVLSSHDKNGESCRRMDGAGKGKSCRGDGVLCLLLLLVEKKSEDGSRNTG